MKRFVLICLFSALLGMFTSSCNQQPATSDSGVVKASVKIKTDANGNTSEQRNIMLRAERDNDIGAMKHLYIISSYTGDVLEYSTVYGKVTSGGKRISPSTVDNTNGYNNYVYLDGTRFTTQEFMDEQGTYGSSGNYLYWFDAQGNYHQYYPSGGTYLHIADRPLRIRKANFTLSLDTTSQR